MKRKFKSIVSVLLTALILLSGFSAFSVSTAATETSKSDTSANRYGLLDEVENGLILHCFCWNFNTIKNNMSKIAEAGYTAVQTSPINKVVVGDGGGMQLNGNGKWYYHYQPTAYTIGNYQLGTESEFKAMCSTAHSYGVKVIVDVVANHTTSNTGAVDNSIKNISGGAYHNKSGGISYASRYDVTQKDLLGLKDLNTQNPNVANHIQSYLKSCVAAGADGFRYDAAKHIELPDDGDFGGNFWPTVLNNGSSFQYGEILQDGSYPNSVRYSAYADYMHVTASSYGYILREAILNNDFDASTLSDHIGEGVADNRLVTWVESHDTYGNGGKSNNAETSFWIDNQKIRLAWAALVAQGGTTSLFFNRPAGSSPSNIWGSNRIGIAGDDNYRSDEVSAVNHFHNAMEGESKTITNIDDNSVVMISRGARGVVIINTSNSDKNIETPTSLAAGSYTDEAHGAAFNVSGNTLTGVVKAGQIAVIYNDTTVKPPSVSISFNGNNSGGDFYDTASVTLYASNTTSATYKLGSANAVSFTNGQTITIGSDMSEGQSVTLSLTGIGADGSSTEASYTFNKKSHPALNGNTVVYYDNSSTRWSSVRVYVYRNGGNIKNAEWPGEYMTQIDDKIWGYVIDDNKFPDAYVIFANENGTAQHNSGAGDVISKGEWKIYSDGKWSDYDKTQPTTSQTVSTASTATSTPSVSYYYGDINCDKRVNINDVTFIQLHLVEIAAYTPSALGRTLGDVNGDGRIKINDANLIQRKLAGITSSNNLTGEIYV